MRELTPDAMRKTAGFVLKNSEDLSAWDEEEQAQAQEQTQESGCSHCAGHGEGQTHG